jgi:hypothetical protein
MYDRDYCKTTLNWIILASCIGVCLYVCITFILLYEIFINVTMKFSKNLTFPQIFVNLNSKFHSSGISFLAIIM